MDQAYKRRKVKNCLQIFLVHNLVARIDGINLADVEIGVIMLYSCWVDPEALRIVSWQTGFIGKQADSQFLSCSTDSADLKCQPVSHVFSRDCVVSKVREDIKSSIVCRNLKSNRYLRRITLIYKLLPARCVRITIHESRSVPSSIYVWMSINVFRPLVQ